MDVFGQTNCELRLFDVKNIKNGDVIDDALDFFGIDASEVKKIRVNESLSLEALSVIFFHNLYTNSRIKSVEQQVYRRQMILALRGFGKEKFGLAEAVLDKFIEQNRKDIEWAESLTGFDLHGATTSFQTPIATVNDIVASALENMDAARKVLNELPILEIDKSKINGSSKSKFLNVSDYVRIIARRIGLS